MIIVGLKTMINQILKDLKLIKEIHSSISIKHLILPAHLILSLFFIYNNESASRYSLSEFLATPITRARKILAILENNNLIIKNIGRKGSILNEKGIKICTNLFSYIKLLNPFESWDIGTVVLGSTNCLVAIPMDIDKTKIDAVKVRDTSMKCGAVGSSIFEVNFLSDSSTYRISFLNDSQSDLSISKGLEVDNFGMLQTKLGSLESTKKSWIVIASTINELPSFYFNPLFSSETIEPFKVVLVSALQSLWEMLEYYF